MQANRVKGPWLKVGLIALLVVCSFLGGVGAAFVTSGQGEQPDAAAQEAARQAEEEKAAQEAAEKAAQEKAAQEAAEKAAQEKAAQEAARQAAQANGSASAPAKPKQVSVRNAADGVEVSWQASDGATGYQVMRKEEGAAWTALISGKLTSPDATKFVDTSVKNAAFYTYAVKALGAAKNSGYDQKGASVVRLSSPSFSGTTIVSKSSIRLHWKTLSKVSGYRLYCTPAQGKRVLVEKITDRKQFRRLVENLEYGKAYTFELQAYAKHDGVEYRSARASVGKRLAVTKRDANGYTLYYDEDGQMLTDVRQFMGKKTSYQLKVNVKECVVNVFAKDESGEYRVPVKTWICSPGSDGSTKTGTWKLGSAFRWRVLFHNSFSQWGAVIHKDILFHTAPYNSYQNKTDLNVKEYNKLGKACSYGCVRMQCEAVKWIHDNCAKGTKVVIYSNDDAGPFGKPALEKLASWHTWDPTDPTSKDLCKEHNCHHDVTQ